MKTIEQLITESKGYYTEGLTVEFEYIEHVEALCKAYMADRLIGLRPVGYSIERLSEGMHEKIEYAETKEAAYENARWGLNETRVKPLYDLTSIKDKL